MSLAWKKGEEWDAWGEVCGCEGEIMAGLYKCQKVMKNAGGWQEIQSFSGVSLDQNILIRINY